jgi:hypothetical protein
LQEQSRLDEEFSVSELRLVVNGMKNKSATGVFGIDIEAVKLLLRNDVLAGIL